MSKAIFTKMVLFMSICIMMFIAYIRIYPSTNTTSPLLHQRIALEDVLTQYYNESEAYLINTPGCSIPNYMKIMSIEESKRIEKSCGERAILVRKISNNLIQFTINEDKMRQNSKKSQYSCCFQFATPSFKSGQVDYTSLSYSKCKPFKNGTEELLENEIIIVNCKINSSKNQVIYEDAYAVIKKINNTKNSSEATNEEKSWNVLIIGMDTMSRARIYESMPKTADYMSRNDWLDYRGYQKVGFNTFPNVMALMTGKNVSAAYKYCAAGMDSCNKLLLWSDFQKAGYVTATGEDFLRLPDTFANLGYKSSPTNHYLRPLFISRERSAGNLVCTQKISSAKHILDYATQFTHTYKNDKHFGMFWFNSYSHNLENIPTLIDDDMVRFFQGLDEAGILNNTFVFFLSDHGMRFGKNRLKYESYYEERLPMFFLWVPISFKKKYLQDNKNANMNQHRLVTPYDVHLTLQELMKWKTNVQVKALEACPRCLSIFNEITPYRRCEDVQVDEKWCTCHEMFNVSEKYPDTKHSIELAVRDIQEKITSIRTTACMKCAEMTLNKVLRIHTYRNDSLNSTYFILAFSMTPGNIDWQPKLILSQDGSLIHGLRRSLMNALDKFNVQVGSNTFPNVMALMTGKNVSDANKYCAADKDSCNKLLLWSDFEKAGYVTATEGEKIFARE